MTEQIPVSSVFKVIEKLLKFPYPQICRHLAACDLLSLLEESGIEISPELAGAVVRCDDETALQILERHHGNN